jgi:signal transduction histidine kinase
VLLIFLGTVFINKITKNILKIYNNFIDVVQRDIKLGEINEKEKDEMEKLSNLISYAAEEIKSSKRIKNDFVCSLSHELRTPLTAIQGWTETMKTGDEIDYSNVRRGLDIIAKETQRLTKIVENLLDFSVFENGKFKIIKEKVDLLAEIEEAVYMFEERAALERKKIIYNEPKLISPVFGDKNRLRQVFINLIDNSLKFTNENGGVSINVNEHDENIFIEITDNGCGISKEELPKITRKFYKANKIYPGSGIGLAIVKEIIDAHDGKMKIFSEKNFGTTIILSFLKFNTKKTL